MATDLFTDKNTDHNTDESFINGIDTQLNINKADSQNEKLQSLGFLGFLDEVQDELKMSVAIFIEVNGHDVDQLIKDNTDINSLFLHNDNYREFLFLFKHVKANIEQLVVAEGPEQLAHQSIVDEVLKLRALIETRYPRQNPVPDAVTPKRPLEFFFGMGILFLPFIFAWFTLRKGYSRLVRVAAFLWLVIFLCAVIPSLNQKVEDDLPTANITEILSDTEIPGADQQGLEQEDLAPQHNDQQKSEQLDFDPQNLEPQDAP